MAKRKLKNEDEVRLFLIGHGDFNDSAPGVPTNPVTFALYYVMEQITLRNMELIERIVYELINLNMRGNSIFLLWETMFMANLNMRQKKCNIMLLRANMVHLIAL